MTRPLYRMMSGPPEVDLCGVLGGRRGTVPESTVETTGVVVVGRPLASVRAYLADFANAERWFPSVRRCSRLDADAPHPGSRWNVALDFCGIELQLEYMLTRSRPHWLTFTGGNSWLSATVDLAFTALPEATEVHASWQYRLRGPLAIAAPVIRRRLSASATRAIARMRAECAASC